MKSIQSNIKKAKKYLDKVVSSTDHMNGPGCDTGQKANQHKEPPECRNSASAVKEERP